MVVFRLSLFIPLLHVSNVLPSPFHELREEKQNFAQREDAVVDAVRKVSRLPRLTLHS